MHTIHNSTILACGLVAGSVAVITVPHSNTADERIFSLIIKVGNETFTLDALLVVYLLTA